MCRYVYIYLHTIFHTPSSNNSLTLITKKPKSKQILYCMSSFYIPPPTTQAYYKLCHLHFKLKTGADYPSHHA